MGCRALQGPQPLTLKSVPAWLTAGGDRQLCRPPVKPLSSPGANPLDFQTAHSPTFTDDTKIKGPPSGACKGSLSHVPAVSLAPHTGRGTQ